MVLNREKARILGLIHCSRGVLISSILVAVYVQFIYRISQPPMDISVSLQYSPFGLVVLALVLEFYTSILLFIERVSNLSLLLITMVLSILGELIVLPSLSLTDNLLLLLHISLVVGVSVIEIGLVYHR